MAYRLPDGSLMPSVPADLELLEQAEARLHCMIVFFVGSPLLGALWGQLPPCPG